MRVRVSISTAFAIAIFILSGGVTNPTKSATAQQKAENQRPPRAGIGAAGVASSSTKLSPPMIDDEEFYVFDPKDVRGFSAPERKALISKWGQCSSSIYNELIAIRQLESGNSAYTGANCAFDEQVTEAIEQRRRLVGAVEEKDWIEARRRFARILYIIQSFYAYSNYTELMALMYSAPKAVPMMRIWDDQSRSALRGIQDLHSGTDIGSSPKKCPPSGIPSRKHLSKAAGGGSKDDPLVGWHGWTKGDGARYLAAIAGTAWAKEVQDKFPGVLGDCGPIVLVALPPEDKQ